MVFLGQGTSNSCIRSNCFARYHIFESFRFPTYILTNLLTLQPNYEFRMMSDECFFQSDTLGIRAFVGILYFKTTFS